MTNHGNQDRYFVLNDDYPSGTQYYKSIDREASNYTQAVGSPRLETLRKNMIAQIGSGPITLQIPSELWITPEWRNYRAPLGANVEYNDTG